MIFIESMSEEEFGIYVGDTKIVLKLLIDDADSRVLHGKQKGVVL